MGSTSFRFTISVTDSKDTASATITVNVININEAPSFDHTSYSVSGDEDVVRFKPPPAEQIIFRPRVLSGKPAKSVSPELPVLPLLDRWLAIMVTDKKLCRVCRDTTLMKSALKLPPTE